MTAEENNGQEYKHLQTLINEIKESEKSGLIRVTPILSNSFRVGQIFREENEINDHLRKDQDPVLQDNEPYLIDHQLAKDWAETYDHPMSDGQSWAHVAQYRQVNPEEDMVDSEKVRKEYITFLKERLLTMGGRKAGYDDKAGQLKTWMDDLSFSEMATEMDYPIFPESRDDPLQLLAKLPFPVYITTSCSDFLERALLKAGKFPRRQICFYSGPSMKGLDLHQPDEKFNPDPVHPAVYYLFGMEEYRPTMVLSEDDYLDFLMKADGDIRHQNFPTPLLTALTGTRLLLLGYNLADWDFRTLFRLILKSRETRPKNKRSFVVQLQHNPDAVKTVDYLKLYYKVQNFGIEWGGTEDFIEALWNAWEMTRPITR